MDDSRDREIITRNEANISASSDDVDDDRDAQDYVDAKERNRNDDQDFDELPVIAYKNEIMDCILRNQIVICISETGR